MAWNCLFIVLRTTTLDDLASIGVTPVGEPVPVEVAVGSTFEGVAATVHGDSTVLINTDQSLFTGGSLLGELLHREAVTALFADATDSYLWRVDGPGLQRTWMCKAGETIEDSGLRAPEEQGLRALDEPSLFGLLALRTGFGADPGWTRQLAQPVSWPPLGPQAKPKRRWFGRSGDPDRPGA
jgi:hypothetical protein